MKDVVFVRVVLAFLQPPLGAGCIRMFEDNQGAIQLANNSLSSARSHHVDMRHRLCANWFTEEK